MTRYGSLSNSLPIEAVTNPYNVKAYGAVGNGTTDDTSAIQAAIDATPAGEKLRVPNGLYKISSALVCSKDVLIEGDSVSEVWGADAITGVGLPGATPWLKGSVFLQVTAGENGINIPGTGLNVSLKNIGIRFADAIAFTNTGHGIYAVPDAIVTVGHDGGVANYQWDNVIIFGHDGNHYAFYSVNPLLGRVSHLRGYGGGGWYMECDSDGGNFGNLVSEDTYFALFVEGTAQGYLNKSRTTTFPGVLNMCVFIRPQCNLGGIYGGLATDFSSVPPAVGDNQRLYKDEGNPTAISLIAPDFECPPDNSAPPIFGVNTYVQIEGGYFTNTGGSPWNYRTKKARGGYPTIVAGYGAGTLGTPTINKWCTDEYGIVDFITSQYPWGADSETMTITLQSFPPIGMVLIQPYMAADSTINSIAAQFYLSNITSNSFTVRSHTGLTGETRYAFQFLVIEGN